MENNRIAKRVHMGEYMGIHLVSRPRKRWNDTVKNCFKKKEVLMSSKQGEWCIIEMNGEDLCEGVSRT